jgi:dTMP kinase
VTVRAQAGAGRLVVLEGGEGVGKTTQWERLGAALRAEGHDVVAVREPGGTAAGDRVRALLLDPSAALVPEAEALLFAASRAQLVREVIRPALARGALVLVDRFLLSTYAYQGAGRGVPMDALRAVNAVATDGLIPDCTVLLRLPLSHAQARVRARGTADRMEREGLAFHQRVEAAFADALLPGWQGAHPEVGPVRGVDAAGTPAEVTARCLRTVAEALADAGFPVAAERGQHA